MNDGNCKLCGDSLKNMRCDAIFCSDNCKSKSWRYARIICENEEAFATAI